MAPQGVQQSDMSSSLADRAYWLPYGAIFLLRHAIIKNSGAYVAISNCCTFILARGKR